MPGAVQPLPLLRLLLLLPWLIVLGPIPGGAVPRAVDPDLLLNASAIADAEPPLTATTLPLVFDFTPRPAWHCVAYIRWRHTPLCHASPTFQMHIHDEVEIDLVLLPV